MMHKFTILSMVFSYILSYGPISFADSAVQLDASYEIADRFCSDGSEPLDKDLLETKGISFVFGSNGKMTISNKNFPNDKLTIDYRFSNGKLLNKNLSTGEEVASPVRINSDVFTMISPLPTDKSEAAKICAGGDSMIAIYISK